MTRKLQYVTKGTCSRLIELEMEDDVVKDVRFLGGCNGNLQGIGALVKGMKADEVIARLDGIRCGDKTTSCPDQLSKALKESLAME